MNRTLLFTSLILGCASATAQDKINMAGRMIIDRYATPDGQLTPAAGTKAPAYAAFVHLAPGYTAADIEALGYTVTADFGDIVTVTDTAARLEALSESEATVYVSFGERQTTNLDFARPSGAVDEVQEGFSYENSTVSFDGTGVVAGMMDIGLEGHHVNFNDPDGNSRIKRLWWYKGTDGMGTLCSGLLFKSFTTDTREESHATHVGGIIGGSYKGNGDYCYVSSASGNTSNSAVGQPIPYYGVATGADLAFSVGMLYDANISNGVKNIIDYAEETGQPCVVNLSLGGTIGPHDGTDSYAHILSGLGEKAIICMSAGNDGDAPISIAKEFTAADNVLRSMMLDNKASGIVDIWTDSDKPVTFKWVIYNSATQEIIPLATLTEASTATVTTANSDFAQGFTGSITIRSTVNALNNRYNIYSSVSASPTSTSSNLLLGFVIEGEAGQKVWVYGQTNESGGTQFTSNSYAGWTSGSASNSINNACCGPNIVSVGAYNSRTTWGVLGSSGTYHYVGNYKVGGISPFSSYGTNFAGESLPHVVAPGAAIISSINRYYINAGYDSPNMMTAKAANGNSTDYWGAMQGTSMSCPYVTGTIALWLQACPSLDYGQVLDVINNSSTYSALSMRPKARWGAGTINARKGIEYILKNYAAIGSVWEDDEARLMVTPSGTGYDVTLAGEASFKVTVYDLQGRPVASAQGQDGSASVDTTALSAGVYVVKVDAPSTSISRKITMR